MRLPALVVLLTFAAAPAFSQGSVNVYNWSDYIAEDQLKVFEKDSGIKVNYTTYDSNEILEAKLRAGRSGCLRRALVLAWLLGRRGFRARVWIGVARDEETLLAHAWIETDHGVFFRAAGLPAAAWHPITSFPLCAGQSPG